MKYLYNFFRFFAIIGTPLSIEFIILSMEPSSYVLTDKMRESIEIEKHSTIDQEGKQLDSTWRAPFSMQT